jgi:thiol-disulfide isomerase/thioredoxin
MTARFARSSALLTSLLLVGWSGVAAAQDDSFDPWADPAEKGEVEVYSWESTVDFNNHPLNNQFVFSRAGTLRTHRLAQGDWEGVVQRLHEVIEERVSLDRAVLDGQELPVEMIRVQAPQLFEGEARLEAEWGCPELGSFSDLEAIHRVLVARYADDVLLRSLGRLVEREWREANRRGRRRTAIQWSAPGLWGSFACQVQPDREDPSRKRVIASIEGQGPGGMGPRELQLTFVGVYDPSGDRFVSLELTGDVRNTELDIQQHLTYRRQLVEVQVVDEDLRYDYHDSLAGLFEAALFTQQGLHRDAAAVWARLRETPDLTTPLERFAGTTADHFAWVERVAAGIRWVERDLPGALARARETGRPVLLLFDQENCPPCMVLHRTVLTAPEFVDAASAGFVTVHLDANLDRALGERYGIPGTPSLLVLNADGDELARQVGMATLPASLRFLEQGLAAASQPAR